MKLVDFVMGSQTTPVILPRPRRTTYTDEEREALAARVRAGETITQLALERGVRYQALYQVIKPLLKDRY